MTDSRLPTRTDARTHTRTYARTAARTGARTHRRTHAHRLPGCGSEPGPRMSPPPGGSGLFPPGAPGGLGTRELDAAEGHGWPRTRELQKGPLARVRIDAGRGCGGKVASSFTPAAGALGTEGRGASGGPLCPRKALHGEQSWEPGVPPGAPRGTGRGDSGRATRLGERGRLSPVTERAVPSAAAGAGPGQGCPWAPGRWGSPASPACPCPGWGPGGEARAGATRARPRPGSRSPARPAAASTCCWSPTTPCRCRPSAA